MKRTYHVVTLMCCLMLCSCGTIRHQRIQESCEKSIKAYNRMLRWQEIENAGATYMVPEAREDFMKTAESIRKRGVSITDFRILTQECVPEKATAEVVAEFDYYILPSNRIKTLTYRQNWVFIETEFLRAWQLKTGIPEFE
jgi:hypothetical protein